MLTVYTSSGDFALSDGGGLTVWSWGELPGVPGATVVVVSWVPPPPYPEGLPPPKVEDSLMLIVHTGSVYSGWKGEDFRLTVWSDLGVDRVGVTWRSIGFYLSSPATWTVNPTIVQEKP